MGMRKIREKIAADYEYETDEGVRTLVNAINLLRASATDDYKFWSAFYKFAVDNDHRVTTEQHYTRLRELEVANHNADLVKAAETINKIPDRPSGKSGYQEAIKRYLIQKAQHNFKK